MKKLLILFMMLIMVAGGTIGTLKFLQLGPFTPVAAPEGANTAPVDDEPSYITMDPLVVPVFQGDLVAGTVQLQLQLAVVKRHEKVVSHDMRRIFDAFLRDLHVYIPRALSRSERLDLEPLKARLLRIANKTMGDEMVVAVLIQSIQEQQGAK